MTARPGGTGAAGRTDRPADPGGGTGAEVRCRALVAALELDGAAVTVRGSTDHGHLVLATDEVARRVEEQHLTLGEGPAIDAFRDATPVAVPDLAAAEPARRWPVLVRELLASGVGALFAFPLRIGDVPFGSVALHRRVPGGLSPAATAAALPAADALARAVLRDLQTTGGRPHRDRVAIATGMVAVQAAVPVRSALALLRAVAFAEQLSLDEIADGVVGRSRRFD